MFGPLLLIALAGASPPPPSSGGSSLPRFGASSRRRRTDRAAPMGAARRKSRWKRRLDGFVALWGEYRDSRCDARLAGYEAGPAADPAACRARITRIILEDMRFRFDLPPGGRPRASIEETRLRPGPEDKGEGVRCADAPPAECDYCAITRCWERRLAADEAALNSAWKAALAKIGSKPGLTPAQRADWTRRLRASQRLWLKWREEACDLAARETPDPAANSTFPFVTGPCRDRETRARTQVLRRTYGR
jgi:uncharacterized protein YecT (DUF1311 family)